MNRTRPSSAIRARTAASDRPGPFRAAVYGNIDELPPQYGWLFAAAARDDFFFTASWYRCLAAETNEPGHQTRFYGIEDQEAGLVPLALFIARASPSRLLRPRVLEGFANQYTVHSGPIISPAASDARPVLERLIEAIRRETPAWDVVAFKALDRSSSTFDLIAEVLRAAGYVVCPYFQFANWHEKLTASSFSDFVQTRGSSIRKTLQRKARRLERSGEASFRVFVDETDIETGIADYLSVYAASWKDDERYPEFVPALIRIAARDRSLRLGIVYCNGQPAATQLAFFTGSTATMYKTAYNEKFKDQAVGGIAVMRVLQHLIDVDHVAELDFGIGDEPYKQEWLTQRRERWGLMAFNRRSVWGLAGAVRHAGPPALTAAAAYLVHMFSPLEAD
jgi:hypothetical protein